MIEEETESPLKERVFISCWIYIPNTVHLLVVNSLVPLPVISYEFTVGLLQQNLNIFTRKIRESRIDKGK